MGKHYTAADAEVAFDIIDKLNLKRDTPGDMDEELLEELAYISGVRSDGRWDSSSLSDPRVLYEASCESMRIDPYPGQDTKVSYDELDKATALDLRNAIEACNDFCDAGDLLNELMDVTGIGQRRGDDPSTIYERCCGAVGLDPYPGAKTIEAPKTEMKETKDDLHISDRPLCRKYHTPPRGAAPKM